MSKNISREDAVVLIHEKQEETRHLYIKLKKLDERAVIPTYAHDGDVGMDMTAIEVEYDADRDVYIYHTGLAFESNFNVGQFLFPRSSNSKTECYLTNSVGIADSAIYRGEIQFRYKNRDSVQNLIEIQSLKKYTLVFNQLLMSLSKTSMNFSQMLFSAEKNAVVESQKVADDIRKKAKNLEYAPYEAGNKVGQMVFLNYPTVHIEVVDELSTTVRGDGGFGSTGK